MMLSIASVVSEQAQRVQTCTEQQHQQIITVVYMQLMLPLAGGLMLASSLVFQSPV